MSLNKAIEHKKEKRKVNNMKKIKNILYKIKTKQKIKKHTKEEIKNAILMIYDLIKDEDLKYYEEVQKIIDYIAELKEDIKDKEEYIVFLSNAHERAYQVIVNDNTQERIDEVIKKLEFLITPKRGDMSFHNNPIYVLEIQEIINKLKRK